MPPLQRRPEPLPNMSTAVATRIEEAPATSKEQDQATITSAGRTDNSVPVLIPNNDPTVASIPSASIPSVQTSVVGESGVVDQGILRVRIFFRFFYSFLKQKFLQPLAKTP